MSGGGGGNHNGNDSKIKLELSVHASKLKNVAGTFKGTSDPYAVVTQMATTPGTQPKVLGKTEVIKNTLNPNWVKVFDIDDYQLGVPMKIAVNVFDEVRKGENITMGAALFDVADLLGARGNTKAKKLRDSGTVFATVRKSTGSGVLRLQMKGVKLKNVEGGFFAKSDPFFTLSRRVNTAGGLTWDVVYRSPVMKNNLNPEWEPVAMHLRLLNGGDLDAPCKISLFDHEGSGRHVAMGSVELSVKQMQDAARTHKSQTLKQKGKNVGDLVFVRADVSGIQDVTSSVGGVSVAPGPAPSAPPGGAPPEEEVIVGGTGPNFVDYVSGGCEFNVAVAIDFTGSNGDPRRPGTLHYMHPHDPNERNPYEKAISAIVGILAKYDTDQRFPVYGFGAKYAGVVRHCFQCGAEPEAHGVAGVLAAYRQVFSSGLVMSGPTVFSEVVDTVADRARRSLQDARRHGRQTYTILLIVTDGAVSNVQDTAASLERAGIDAPMSVVIVGVGDADFGAMQFLDDVAASSGRGLSQTRDIAQFVQFNRHERSSVSLTSETLDEIPAQLVDFFQARNIAPLPPVTRSDSSLSVAAPAPGDDEEIDLSLDIQEDEIVVTGGGTAYVDGYNARY